MMMMASWWPANNQEHTPEASCVRIDSKETISGHVAGKRWMAVAPSD